MEEQKKEIKSKDDEKDDEIMSKSERNFKFL